MTKRQSRLILVSLGVCFAFAPPAQAQRSGFIIGVGLGPGFTSYSAFPDRQSKAGLAIDFHIGGVIGDSFELFYVYKGNVFGSDATGVSNMASGVSGLGFAYPLNPDFSITGALGLGVWLVTRDSGTQTTESEGVGLLGGGRYQLSESGRWMLNFDIMYGRPMTDFNAFGAQVTINVVSH